MDLEEKHGVSAVGFDVWFHRRAWRQRNTLTWSEDGNFYTREEPTTSRVCGTGVDSRARVEGG